jgi:hypothetical protein
MCRNGEFDALVVALYFGFEIFDEGMAFYFAVT